MLISDGCNTKSRFVRLNLHSEQNVKKNKQKDLIRSVLPSTGRKRARESSREINRRTRHRIKQALHDISPEEDFDESEFYGKASVAEARHKSEMRWRVSDRRGADKLGPLKRVTQHLKKTSKNDSEAHEKLCRLLEPGKNLITRHALSHAEWYLDCPEKEYYLPPETERDRKFRENRYKPRGGKVIWGKRKFKRIIKWLIEHAHKELNRALKGGRHGLALMTTRSCKVGEDPCATMVDRTHTRYEIYDPSRWSNWRQVYSYFQYDRLIQAGETGRIRHITKPEYHHNARLCQNRLLAFKQEDYLIIAKRLSDYNGQVRENDFEGTTKAAEVLRGIRILVKKYNL